MAEETLREAFRAAGQEHVFRAYDRLEGDARDAFLAQLERVDLALTGSLRDLVAAPAHEEAPADFEPPELFPLRRSPAEEERAAAALVRGRELLEAGRVGYVLVAGGQASRLGYDAPKGFYRVGPVTGRSLFEVHARRLLKARRGGTVRAPWYIMTSPANDAETREFFEHHGTFGLPAEDVVFFAQAMLPALDESGRILLSAPDSLFLAPNGHGGLLSGLRESGAIEHMRERGVEELCYFQVDNPLVRPADPLFIGLHNLAGAGMSSKVVTKRDAAEKVGVIGRTNGRLGCIEYSDLPPELLDARDPDGELRFRAGNIAMHVISVEFLEELTSSRLDLPWHVARKKMKVVNEEGNPEERIGFKFETFVFDALARSRSSVTLEVERSAEFTPLKNAEGLDSPATVRADLCRLYSSWTTAAGLALPEPDSGGLHPVEVDPMLAETEEEFLAHPNKEPHECEAGHYYA